MICIIMAPSGLLKFPPLSSFIIYWITILINNIVFLNHLPGDHFEKKSVYCLALVSSLALCIFCRQNRLWFLSNIFLSVVNLCTHDNIFARVWMTKHKTDNKFSYNFQISSSKAENSSHFIVSYFWISNFFYRTYYYLSFM